MNERAIHLLSLARPEEALRELAGGDPDDGSTWYLRGLALARLERWDEAAQAAERGLAVDAESPELLALLASCRQEINDLAGAEEAILAALRLDASNAAYLARYALLLGRAGQSEKAKRVLARAAEQDPLEPAVLRTRALFAYAEGDGGTAALRARELLAIDPEDAYAHYLAGHIEDDPERARAFFTSAARLDPHESSYAEAARRQIALAHWLLWPLWPVQRFGAVPVWLAGITILFVLPRLSKPAGAVFTWVWIAYIVYSWIAPPLVRRLLWRRR